MERMPSFEYRPPRPENSGEVKTPFEARFFIEPKRFEQQTGIPTREVTRLLYRPDDDTFQRVSRDAGRERGEVLHHGDSNTLVVPPPTGGTLSVADLAEMTVPVVGFIGKRQPDIVVGCDRGARLYGVAVHSMWNDMEQLGQQQHFPTLDRQLHFARLSTSLGVDVTSGALAHIIEASQQEAQRQGRQQNADKLGIMFIDDWISSGATRRQIMESIKRIGMQRDVNVSFAVMCGSGGDVSGGKGKGSVFWHDDPNIIGVNYTRDGYPVAKRTQEAKATRRSIHTATRRHARQLQRR